MKKSVNFEFSLCIAALLCIAGIAVSAENLLKGGDAEDAATVKKWGKDIAQNTEDKVSGKSSFQIDKKTIRAISPGYIEIDPEKTYKLSGSFKSAGKDKGRCYFGLMMYNDKKRGISRNYLTYRAGTQTKLAEEAKAGDKVIKLADCSKWLLKHPRTLLAFGAKEDFSDLPNTDLSPSVTKIEKQGDVYEVTLKSPLKKNYPAGTEVRQHFRSGGYQYCAASNKQVPKEWTKYSGTVKGINPKGLSNKQFWPGTKYVRVIIFANYGAKKDEDCKTLFDDIVFEEVPEKE